MPALTKGAEDTLSRAELKHEDEPLEMESDQGGSPARGTPQAVTDESFAPGDVAWFERFSALVIGGVAEALASHLHWLERKGNCIQFLMDPEHATLMGDQQVARLEVALSTSEGEPITIQISVERPTGASPAMISAAASMSPARRSWALTISPSPNAPIGPTGFRLCWG